MKKLYPAEIITNGLGSHEMHRTNQNREFCYIYDNNNNYNDDDDDNDNDNDNDDDDIYCMSKRRMLQPSWFLMFILYP